MSRQWRLQNVVNPDPSVFLAGEMDIDWQDGTVVEQPTGQDVLAQRIQKAIVESSLGQQIGQGAESQSAMRDLADSVVGTVRGLLGTQQEVAARVPLTREEQLVDAVSVRLIQNGQTVTVRLTVQTLAGLQDVTA